MRHTSSQHINSIRAVFAKQILALANALGNERLERAFATVPRERFLGPGQWQILTPWDGYTALPENDPALIYQDVLVGLAANRGVNNGSPALHARWLNAMRPKPGEVVAHIGAGTGYYTSVLAELVSPAGKVIAVEYDADLAAELASNLATAPNTEVICADGASQPEFPVDCLYVNFGVACPASRWVENLRLGGRLILPLGVPEMHATLPIHVVKHAIGLMITRQHTGFAATSLGAASFVFAQGQLAVSNGDIDALRESLKTGEDHRIRSLVWGAKRDAPAWFSGEDWALSFEELA
ncbi:Protein-L-isoaspartate O-methyltransferase [Pandoraea horticolens]|uniref:Protein-L-isoaspartate O-methyltransferase n=1 Tax=Pandoraea horticolens TaxID=2508298 RepID=A0A5E4YNY3_9BURK|nr:rRNA adenine N-6-methyltransferase family protein [Pandoraea horticolens]VVE50232.1 Protein-L-isoaspartate O-methyltransferase [Pandoraea horticolens]